MIEPRRAVDSRELTVLGAALRGILDRFMTRVEIDAESGCWIWKTTQRYGLFWVAGRNVLAHRVAYELFIGSIPPKMQVDHECEVTVCVNPMHLRLATPQQNTRASSRSPAGMNARKTHCKRGHAFDEANTYVHPRRGIRQCRQCGRDEARDRMRERYVPVADRQSGEGKYRGADR
jgi:hypothetical protein